MRLLFDVFLVLDLPLPICFVLSSGLLVNSAKNIFISSTLSEILENYLLESAYLAFCFLEFLYDVW